jgi:uncharacterized protein (TIRG00374 family)
LAGAAALTLGAFYVLVPAIAGLDETWGRIQDGSVFWLVAALLLEIFSYGAYVVAVRAVIGAGTPPIGWRDSARITMAGIVASRLFATAGAGGIAVTAWALHRLGMEPRELTKRLSALMVMIYAVFMAALALAGLALWLGLAPGKAPVGLTLVPALAALGVIAAALMLAIASEDLDAAADRITEADGWIRRVGGWVAAAPATLGSGVRNAVRQLGEERIGLAGAIGWWAFDVGVLLACLAAFGDAPSVAAVVCAYFLGQFANTLPVPGGIGAVEGGMVGALIGFGTGAGLAVVAVLAYRFFAFWLPIAPGAIAYAQLLRVEPAAIRQARSSVQRADLGGDETDL